MSSFMDQGSSVPSLDYENSTWILPQMGWSTLTSDTMLVNESSFDHVDNKSARSESSSLDSSKFYYDLITVVVYSLIIIISLCGNSLVLRMILAKKKLQTTTNILIAWLAVSDLLTTTLNIPFNVARFLAMNYPFPALFCKLVPFIQVMCVYVSTFTMGVIAVHRYLTVTSSTRTTTTNSFMRPLLLHGSLCLCFIMTVVWLVAGLLATPHSMFNQIVYVPYKNKTYVRCRAEYPNVDFNFRFVLSVEAFLTQYLIPLGLICVLYIKIGSVVAKQGRVAQKANSRRRMEQDSARRRRLTMLILVVLMFGICWMPLNLFHLLVDFHLIKFNFTVFLVCHWIAMSSVCWNPFIYCWLNESFRKGATKMIIFICCCCCPRMRRKLLIQRRSSNEMSTAVAADSNRLIETEPITCNHNTMTTSLTVINHTISLDNSTAIGRKLSTSGRTIIEPDGPIPRKNRRKFPKLRSFSFRKNRNCHHQQIPSNGSQSANFVMDQTDNETMETSQETECGGQSKHIKQWNSFNTNNDNTIDYSQISEHENHRTEEPDVDHQDDEQRKIIRQLAKSTIKSTFV